MSFTSISLEIEGVRHGWAVATVRAGEVSYRMDGFSYTTFAFDDLARFGVAVALDAFKAEAEFDAEPSGWRWEFEQVFHPPHGPAQKFRIFEVYDHYDRNSPRQEVLSVDADRDQLAGAILTALKRLQDEMGIDAFEEAWGQPYPTRGTAALEVTLATKRRAPLMRDTDGIVVRVVSKRDE